MIDHSASLPSERAIARHCDVSRPTIARWLRGEPIRAASRRRIVSGLVELGVLDTPATLAPEAAAALGLTDPGNK